MKDIAMEIRTVVQDALVIFVRMKPEEVTFKAAPDKWSKKEILGHLIDSAANNHQRFVRAAANIAVNFPAYNQNEWVRIQRYNDSNWDVLLKLWSAYNFHLSDIIERLPESSLSSLCNIGKENPVSLEFVIKDYLRHLKHHLTVLLER